jgi:hypothetical protein
MSDQTHLLGSPILPRPEPAPTALKRRSRSPWLGRSIARREATTYHRCLAVHIYHASTRSALT